LLTVHHNAIVLHNVFTTMYAQLAFMHSYPITLTLLDPNEVQ